MSRLYWAGFALLALSLTTAGCGGSVDASKDPTAAPLIQSRSDQIERYKTQSNKPAAAARTAPVTSQNFKRR